MLERRKFIRNAAVVGGVVGGSAALGFTATSCATTETAETAASALLDQPGEALTVDELAAQRDQWARIPAAFNRKVTSEIDDQPLQILSGELPVDLAGHVFIQSLALGETDAGLSGDPLIWRLDFNSDQPRVTSKILRTTDYLLGQAVADTEFAFEPRGVMRLGPLGLQNQPNTAFVQMDGNRLFATVDGGRPWEFDPKSLDPVSPLGRLDEYRSLASATGVDDPLCPMVITSAHPPYDPETGEYYGVSMSIAGVPGAGFFEVLCWSGDGAITRVPLVLADGQPLVVSQNAHQLCVTRHHLVILDAAGTIEPGKLSNPPNSEAAGIAVAPNPDSYLYIVSREDLRRNAGVAAVQRVVISHEAGHCMVDYDSSPSRLVLHVPHTSASDFAEWVQPYDIHPLTQQPVRSELANAITPVCYDSGVIGRYEIDATTGAVLDQRTFYNDWTWGSGGLTTRNPKTPLSTLGDLFHANSGFPTDLAVDRVYSGFIDHPHRLTEVAALPWDGVPSNLARIDHDNGVVVDGYWFGGDRFGWTPTFVPRHGTATGSTDGYIVSIVYSDEVTDDSAGTEIWIFDAADLAAGPIVRLGRTDLAIPLTLHSVWLDSLESTRPDYVVDAPAEMLIRAETWSSSPEIAALVRDVVARNYAGQVP